MPALVGDPENTPCAALPVLQVCLVATAPDTSTERGVMAEDVWPYLREMCTLLGTELAVVDLSWAERRLETLARPYIQQAALAEAERVYIAASEAANTTGSAPVVAMTLALVGDKYGPSPPPLTVPQSTFKGLREMLTRRDARLTKKNASAQQAAPIFNRWYKLDDTHMPPCYALRTPMPALGRRLRARPCALHPRLVNAAGARPALAGRWRSAESAMPGDAAWVGARFCWDSLWTNEKHVLGRLSRVGAGRGNQGSCVAYPNCKHS
ncbi:hypothetical protein CYMTET_34139 [Cymbomonas tetramitiformis]|uniref:Uncharacterized protein n=1 Tax=Cymbomonas tetramitiformis TaxID=36881 RepID=A0AAE0FBS4_9CHLO|nr:hypothetical protein CYMTET_34139 [Cymbomonas tetramitiformis]